MKSKYVSSVDDFHWQRNLRYYWNTDALEGLGHLTVAMVNLISLYCSINLNGLKLTKRP